VIAVYRLVVKGKGKILAVMCSLGLFLFNYTPAYVVHDPNASAILVVGSSSGIGNKITDEISKLGFTVFATVRKESDASKLPSSSKVIPLILDVTNQESIDAAYTKIKESNIPLVGLVQNAGVYFGNSLTDLTSEEECKHIMEVNYWGPRRVIRKFLPVLRESNGRILLSSSGLGSISIPLVDCYPGTKWALNHYAHFLRQQEALLDTGVSVSLLNIGSIKTRMSTGAAEQIEDVTACEKRIEELSGDKLKSFWQKYCDSSTKAAEALRQAGNPIEVVVPPHIHALTSSRPKTEYTFGFDSKLALSLRYLLPNRVFDALLLSSYQ